MPHPVDPSEPHPPGPNRPSGVWRVVAGVLVAAVVCGGIAALSLWASNRAATAKAEADEKFGRAIRSSLYFPTTVGAKTVMELTVNGHVSERTEIVTRVERKGEGYRVTVGTEAYRVSKAGIAMVTLKGLELDKPWWKLRLPARVAESWTEDESWVTENRAGPEASTVLPARTIVVGLDEEVDVPAGSEPFRSRLSPTSGVVEATVSRSGTLSASA